jgi:hypothetical protein
LVFAKYVHPFLYVFWLHFQKGLKVEFEGFESLFRRYLQESETAINWNRIEPLPKQSVSA